MLGCSAALASLSDCGGELAEGRDGWMAAEDSGVALKSRHLTCASSRGGTRSASCAVETVVLFFFFFLFFFLF